MLYRHRCIRSSIHPHWYTMPLPTRTVTEHEPPMMGNQIIDVLFPLVGWLIEGLETSPFLQQVMMIDGYRWYTSHRPKPIYIYIYTKRTSLNQTFSQEISELKEQFDCARNLQDADLCAVVDWHAIGPFKRRSVLVDYMMVHPEMALFHGQNDDKTSNFGALYFLFLGDKPV